MTSPPNAAYLVCASQRSGSTLLVESLRSTGVAGEPEEFFQYLPHSGLSPRPREWFEDVTDPAVLDLLPALETGGPDERSADEWVTDVAEAGRGPNGVWGGKLMGNQVPNLLARTSGLTGRTGTDLRSAITDVIGIEPVLVHVRRPDVVPQAVSMWRAVQTEVWRGPTPPELDQRAQYNADGIAHLARILADQDRSWLDWFASEGIEPITLDFATLTTRLRATVQRVLGALGLDPELAPADPPLRRQGDARSDDWVTRYRADAEERDLPR